LYELNLKKRCLVTERPVACLLSGGLDSSLVAALANEYIGQSNPIETYSIGLKGSVDLKYAKIVADYLGTKHTEIVLTEKEFVDAGWDFFMGMYILFIPLYIIKTFYISSSFVLSLN
jgi:asparagine synthetase B (glutamine-hydrolysing)